MAAVDVTPTRPAVLRSAGLLLKARFHRQSKGTRARCSKPPTRLLEFPDGDCPGTFDVNPTNKSTNKPTRETVGRAAYTSTFPGVCLHVDVSDRDYARRFRCWLSASRKTLRGHGKFGRCLKQICWPFPRVLRGNRRDGLGVLLSLSLTTLPRRTRVIDARAATLHQRGYAKMGRFTSGEML